MTIRCRLGVRVTLVDLILGTRAALGTQAAPIRTAVAPPGPPRLLAQEQVPGDDHGPQGCQQQDLPDPASVAAA